MPAASIEEPYSFATLPKPLDSKLGRIFGSSVYGYRAGQKRKRREVAVSIDGESVNIYNVQHQNLICSYGLPPRTLLCCAPTSIHVKQPISPDTRRETYMVVKDGENDSRKRLLCIFEPISSIEKDSNIEGLGIQKPAKKELEILGSGQVVGLDVISRGSQGHVEGSTWSCSSTVVVTFDSGDIWCYNTASSQTWHERDPESRNHSYEVQYSALVEFNTARRGLLKNRADIIAILDPKVNSRVAAHFILCHVVHIANTAQLRLYALRSSNSVDEQGSSSRLQLVLSHELPLTPTAKSAESSYDLYAQSGFLYRLSYGRLSVYDINLLQPKLLFQLRKNQSEIVHFARLSASSVVGITAETATIFETDYGSELASISLNTPKVTGDEGRKRKRSEGIIANTFVPISAFADLDMVVGIVGHEMQCLAFSHGQRPSKRHRPRPFLLADVLNNGIQDAPRALQSDRKIRQWQDWKNNVDQMFDQQDAAGLERLVIYIKGLDSSKTNGTKDSAQSDERANGTHIVDVHSFVGFRESLRSNDARKALYLLKKTFKDPQEGENGLSIRFSSPPVLTWLAYHGSLSVPFLRKALARNELRSGDIFNAVALFDSTFQTVSSLLALPVQWDVAEMVETLRILLQSFRTPSRDGAQLAPPSISNGDEDAEMTDSNAEAELRRETEAAFQELDLTSELFKHGLETRGHILHIVLARLHTFSQKTVSSVMRTRLTHEDVVFFIELMRLELAYGGWTSRYVDAGEDEFEEGMVNALGSEEESGPSNQAIRAITDLLNCAVDAIGINGWLVGLSGHLRQATELIENLRTEVSAGLEGCYEASMMGDFVNMVEQCTALAQTQTKQNTMQEGDNNGALLPLGGSNESPIGLVRPRVEVQKSRIAAAQEKSRAVGRYSIDRVRI